MTAITLRPATASTIGWASCAASTITTSLSSPTSQMLLSTSHVPPSSAKVPVGDDTLDAQRPLTARPPNAAPRRDAWSSNASSTWSSLMRSLTNLLQRQAALLVQVDERREVPLGQAVAVPRRLQRAAAGEEVDQRHLQRHVGSRHAHQHDGAGEIAGIERLPPGFRAADRVDDDVGAEAAGQFLHRLDRVRASTRRSCGWRPIPLPSAASWIAVDGDDR